MCLAVSLLLQDYADPPAVMVLGFAPLVCCCFFSAQRFFAAACIFLRAAGVSLRGVGKVVVMPGVFVPIGKPALWPTMVPRSRASSPISEVRWVGVRQASTRLYTGKVCRSSREAGVDAWWDFELLGM